MIPNQKPEDLKPKDPALEGVYEACAEVGFSEGTFRRATKEQLARVTLDHSDNAHLATLLKPYHRITEAPKFTSDRPALKVMFDAGQHGKAVMQICKDIENVLDTTHDDFMSAIIHKKETDKFCEEELLIKEPHELTILPTQRPPRYKILLEALLKEVKAYNNIHPTTPIPPEVLTQLDATLKKVKGYNNELNDAQGIKNFFGDDEEMVQLFIRLKISIPKEIEENSALAKTIADAIRYPPLDQVEKDPDGFLRQQLIRCHITSTDDVGRIVVGIRKEIPPYKYINEKSDRRRKLLEEGKEQRKAEAARLGKIFASLEPKLEPRPGSRITTKDLITVLMSPQKFDTKYVTDFVRRNFKNASVIIPSNPDKPFRLRTYNRITGDKSSMKFLSGEPSLQRLEGMLDEAIAGKHRPMRIHLHVLSVLDAQADAPKIQNVKAIQAFFLATYKNNPKYKGIDLQITHEVLPMHDHQMRNEDGTLLDFEIMDKRLAAHRGLPEEGVHQVYNIHCKAGQGRSATVMTCEDVRYNGLLPSESSAQIKASRKGARGVQDGDFRPDQMCFIYSYFFHAVTEALDPKTAATSRSSKLAGKVVQGDPASIKPGLITEMKYALSINFDPKNPRLDHPKTADTTQWATQLTTSFLEFRDQFKKTHKIDILDQLLIDYAKNPSGYSPEQKKNLQHILEAANYPTLASMSDPRVFLAKERDMITGGKPPYKVLQESAVSIVENAERNSHGIMRLLASLGIVKPPPLTPAQLQQFRNSSFAFAISQRIPSCFPPPPIPPPTSMEDLVEHAGLSVREKTPEEPPEVRSKVAEAKGSQLTSERPVESDVRPSARGG